MRVAMVGTGYVGLVSAACLAAVGHRVTCVDTAPARIGAVARGEPPMVEDGLPQLVRDGVQSGRLSATTRMEDGLTDAEIVMIAVGTPSVGGIIDLTGLEIACRQVGAALHRAAPWPVVAVKSTVVPGTTDTLVRRALEQGSGGTGFGLAMNPEFLSQGSAVRDFMEPDRIVIGAGDRRAADIMAALYRPFAAPLLHMGLRDAEMVKYAANGLQATLISYANQIAALCEAVPGLDQRNVMAAVHLDRMLDGPAGHRAGATRFLMGGIGFGGSCFPKDLVALAGFARRMGVPAPLIEAVSAINDNRVDAVIRRLTVELGGLAGRRIAVLGLAFKPGTDDLRESPGLKIAHRLAACGAIVDAHDPLEPARRNAHGIRILDTAQAALATADAAIIATAWPEYRACDWAALPAMTVLDGRGVLDGLSLPPALRVIRMGVGPDTILNTARESA